MQKVACREAGHSNLHLDQVVPNLAAEIPTLTDHVDLRLLTPPSLPFYRNASNFKPLQTSPYLSSAFQQLVGADTPCVHVRIQILHGPIHISNAASDPVPSVVISVTWRFCACVAVRCFVAFTGGFTGIFFSQTLCRELGNMTKSSLRCKFHQEGCYILMNDQPQGASCCRYCSKTARNQRLSQYTFCAWEDDGRQSNLQH